MKELSFAIVCVLTMAAWTSAQSPLPDCPDLVRALQDMMRAVIALHPDVVVILAGTNDIAGNTGPMTDEGHKIALFGLNLRVEPGEILGFLGPNGAGKSTTVKILTGMIRPTSGRASVAGFDVVEQPMEAKKRIGYVPETAALYDGLTAAEYLELIACLHHLDRDTARARSVELLDLFGLTADQGPLRR